MKYSKKSVEKFIKNHKIDLKELKRRKCCDWYFWRKRQYCNF